MGLTENASKCGTLSIVVRKGSRQWFVADRPFLRMSGELVPALSIEDSYRYLGLQVGADGASCRVSAKLEARLRRVCKAPLKPQQRLWIVRSNILPSLLHELVFGTQTASTLNSLDRITRKGVRHILHLPKDTPKGYFHASVADGGLGLANLRTMVPSLQVKRMHKAMLSEDPAVAACVRTAFFQKSLATSLRLTVFDGKDLLEPAERKVYWKECMLATADARGLRANGDVRSANRFIGSDDAELFGSTFVGVINLRAGVLWSPARAARMCGDPRVALCDYGDHSEGTLAHILQSCARTHGQRVERHNQVANFLKRSSEALGWTVQEEPQLMTEAGLRKPDLVLSVLQTSGPNDSVPSPAKKRVIVVDVVICSDDSDHLSNAYARKVSKYDLPEIRDALSRHDGEGELDTGNSLEVSVEFWALAVSWRGAVHPQSAKLMKTLGLRNRDLSDLSRLVCRLSYWIYTTYREATTVAGGRNGRPVADRRGNHPIVRGTGA